LSRSRGAFEFSRNNLRASILALALLLTATIPHAIRCQADGTTKHDVLGKVAREWIQVGKEQYDRSLFEAAAQSFSQAAQYSKYLSSAEQKNLDELAKKADNAASANKLALTGIQTTDRFISPAKRAKVKSLYDRSPPTAAPVKARRPADSVKDGRFLTEKELEFVAERSVSVVNPLREHRRIQIRPPRPPVTRKLKGREIAAPIEALCSERVFVTGRVGNPGAVQMTGEMKVLEAIMEAGGFDLGAAEFRNAIVIRYVDGRRYAYKLDLREAIAGNETRPLYLQARDIVHVPGTRIAKLNQWIDRHIDEIIPETIAFLSKAIGNSAVAPGHRR
jgi:hypothetical protein